MARFVKELDQILVKQQATFGTAESSLANTNLAEVESGAMVSYEPAIEEEELIGVGFPQGNAIVGPEEASISLMAPMRTGGVEGTVGLIGLLLRCCGFKETASDTDSDSTDDRFIYTPSDIRSEWKDATIWGYTGDKSSNAAILRKMSNVMFGGKISLDFNTGKATFQADGKGAYNGPAVAGTQATTTASGVIRPALKGVTFSFMGESDLTPINMEIDFSQEPVVNLDPTTTSGKGITVVRGRKIKFTLKCYADSVTVFDPETYLRNRTEAAFSLSWGTVPNKFTISSSKAQITGCPMSDENGITTWDLSGHFVGNNFSVQIDTATA